MRRTTLGLSALLLTASCENSCWTKDYSFVRHGRLVTVYGYGLSESDACAGSFDELESHTELIRQALGLHAPASYTVRWFSEDHWETVEPCSASAFACTRHGVGMSRTLPEMHEMVHVVMRSADRECVNVLEEGLAGYFDGPMPWEWYPPDDYSIEQLLVEEEIPLTAAGYAFAAHFVSFLVENFGPEAVMKLCRSLPRSSSLAQWDVAAHRVLGSSLDQLLADYAVYPVCSGQQLRARLWGCRGEPDFTFSPEDPFLAVVGGCSDTHATNAAWGDAGNAVLHRLVYFPEDTWVEVSARSLGESGTDAMYVTQECVSCSEDPQVFVELDDVDIQFYEAGLHEVSVFFDKRDAIRLTMKAHF